MTSITIVKGDITKMAVDAIVNAANESLSDGSGVNGAIQQAAGRQLLEECQSIGGCPTGQAKITKGYKLPAKHVIHAVGPVWHGGNAREEQLLHDAYYSALALAQQHMLRTIAFPNISTGIFGYPKKQAAATALKAVSEFCRTHPDALSEITFVCFDEENYGIYRDLFTAK